MYKNGKPNYNEIVFDDLETQDIITRYLSGESSVSIGKTYNVSHKIILKLLHKNNIDVNRKYSTRKYSVDEEYFNEIDTQNKAYILGFLFADGHNGISKSTLTMSLQESDVDILESIRKELKSEKSLEYLDYSSKHDFGYSYKNQYRLNIFSKQICESLKNYGMVENKSLVLQFPEIPIEHYSHFIRGYFDGDGSLCRYIKSNGTQQCLLTITSTNDFCEKLCDICKSYIGINGHIYDASCHNGITKVFTLSGNVCTKIFLDWIYQDAEMFLRRKHERYLDYYNINKSSVA